MNRTQYAGTPFMLPSCKKFWDKCGELDSIVEFQETCHLDYLERFYQEEAVNGIAFGEYNKNKGDHFKTGLGNFKVIDYGNTLYGTYLLTSFAAFDAFLQSYVEDVRNLKIKISLRSKIKSGSKIISVPYFIQVINALKKRRIVPNFESWSLMLYTYYKHRRNAVSHCLDANSYISDLNSLQNKKVNPSLTQYS